MATNLENKINRIASNVSAALAKVADKGVNVPAGANSDDLGSLIDYLTKLPALSSPGSAADLRSGKELIDGSGDAVAGTMPDVTVPTPSVSVSSAGLITATAEQSAGYTPGGTKSGTRQLTVQAAQTITPGTSNKTIASGRYLTGTQTIKGDANLLPENIAEGVSIFGVLGSLTAGASNVYVATRTFAQGTSSATFDDLPFLPNVHMYMTVDRVDKDFGYLAGVGTASEEFGYKTSGMYVALQWMSNTYFTAYGNGFSSANAQGHASVVDGKNTYTVYAVSKNSLSYYVKSRTVLFVLVRYE